MIIEDSIYWPLRTLRIASIKANLIPFTRSGGRTIGSAASTPIRTDMGWWSIQYAGVKLSKPDERRTWEAIAGLLNGRSGLIAVPVWTFESAPYINDIWQPVDYTLSHSDSSLFDDSSGYEQDIIHVENVNGVTYGATILTLRCISSGVKIVGAKFSYQHALYKIIKTFGTDDGNPIVQITPSIRAPIPADARLSFDIPTCLCRLETDTSMDGNVNIDLFDRLDVSFTEANDVWSYLADES